MIDCVPPPPWGGILNDRSLSGAISWQYCRAMCDTHPQDITHTHMWTPHIHQMGLYRPWQLSYTVLVNSVHTELVLYIQYHETGRLRKHASSGL